MKKPIIIKNQKWLKEILKGNYYIYNNKGELKNIAKRKLKFKEIDYSYLTLDFFQKNLENIIFSISK